MEPDGQAGVPASDLFQEPPQEAPLLLMEHGVGLGREVVASEGPAVDHIENATMCRG